MPKSISVSISDASTTTILFYDPKLPFEARWMDLVLRLTVEEKVAQMLHEGPAIPRSSIAECSWYNECVHGVARAGIAMVFPQAIGLAEIKKFSVP